MQAIVYKKKNFGNLEGLFKYVKKKKKNMYHKERNM